MPWVFLALVFVVSVAIGAAVAAPKQRRAPRLPPTPPDELN